MLRCYLVFAVHVFSFQGTVRLRINCRSARPDLRKIRSVGLVLKRRHFWLFNVEAFVRIGLLVKFNQLHTQSNHHIVIVKLHFIVLKPTS